MFEMDFIAKTSLSSRRYESIRGSFSNFYITREENIKTLFKTGSQQTWTLSFKSLGTSNTAA